MTPADLLIGSVVGQLVALGGVLVLSLLVPLLGIVVLIHFTAAAVEAA